MLIDFHTHILPPEVKSEREFWVKKDPCFSLLYSNPSSPIISAEELINSMDENSITASVVLNIGWTDWEICQRTNDYILEAIARYPKRLFGFISVPPSVELALKEIERCITAGIKGVGEIRPDMGFDLKDKGLWQPIIEMIKKNALILLLHCSEPVGHIYPGKGKTTPEVIYPFISSFPDLTLVCAHWGGGLPFYALMPEVASSLVNVYFDTAATPYLYNPDIYLFVSKIIGAEKILFGSDYPLISPRKYIAQIQSLDLKEEEKAMILGGNAKRILMR